MAQIGNKQNAILNRELGKHHTSRFGRSRNRFYRRMTSKRRRLAGKRVVFRELAQALSDVR